MHLLPSLGELIEAPGPEHKRIASMLGLPGEATRSDFTNLFVVQLFPHASLYLSPHGRTDARIRADIAQFFERLGAKLPEEPDHIAALLKWYGLLQGGSYGRYISSETTLQLRRAFFWSVVASWLPVYLLRARELGSMPYKAWAEVTLDALEGEAAQVASPTLLPHYLASAPALPPVSDANGFVDALFAPAVSGLILCRADLGRCAQANGLLVRVADRRQTLKLFLTQNLAGVCQWLREEGMRQAENMRGLSALYGSVRETWVQRAEQSALLLEQFQYAYARQKPFNSNE